jgi:AbrB family looped-hinge helix DNA binding protein
MRITLRDKRQITLPAEICEALGIESGDSLEATVEGQSVTLKPSRKAALDALEEIRRSLQESGVTLEELLEGGREVRKEIFRETYPDLAEKYGI